MIFISGGHHPKAKGAAFGTFNEYEEASLWVKRLSEIINKDYFIIVPTGGLRSKVAFINKKIQEYPDPHIAIEIHFNSDPSHGGKGSETLYYPKSHYGHELANQIQDKLGIIFEPNRGTKEGWFGMDRPGIVDYAGDIEGDEKPDYFLRKTNCPALIIEPEFIHNQDKIVEARDAGCQVIAQTLINVLGDGL